MPVQTAGVEAGVLLGGVGVHLAADGVHILGQLGGGPALGALEQHMLDEVGRAVLAGALVSGTHPHKKAQGGGPDAGDLLRQQPGSVGQGDTLMHGSVSVSPVVVPEGTQRIPGETAIFFFL